MEKRHLSLIVQLVSFSVLLHLLNNGYAYVAIGAMLALSVFSVASGRIFCRYICPIRTMERASMAARGRLGIRRTHRVGPLPSLLAAWLSLSMLALLVLQVLSPLLPIDVRAPVIYWGFLMVALLPGALWHNNLCPFALLMRARARLRPVRPSKGGPGCTASEHECTPELAAQNGEEFTIDESGCILCYRCAKSCPLGAIE